MYCYTDYFDPDQEGVPYEPGEELGDYITLLDMLLERCLERKGFYKEKKPFSRGLVITESEMKQYFSTAPLLRDVEDGSFFAEYYDAMELIRSRSNAKDSFTPMKQIFEKFSLGEYERIAVLLAMAVRIDRKYERIYGYLQDQIMDREPTTGLLETVWKAMEADGGSLPEDLFKPEGDLSRFFWLMEQEETAPFPLRRVLKLHPMMANALLGLPDETPFWKGGFSEEYPGSDVFAKELEPCRKKIYGAAAAAADKEGYYALETTDFSFDRYLEYRNAAENGECLYILDLRTIPPKERKYEHFAYGLQELMIRRRLHPGRLLIRMPEAEQEARAAFLLLKQMHFILPGEPPAAICDYAKLPEFFIERGLPAIPLEKPEVDARCTLWKSFLPESLLEEDVFLEDIADCYEISFGEIERAADYAITLAASSADASREKGEEISLRGSKTAKEKKEASGDPKVSREMLIQAILRQNTVRFGALASEIRPVYDWEDITMQDSQRKVLKTACNRYKLRNRIGDKWGLKKKNAYGNGVSILLYGPPGTGKTMAAQVVAREVGLPLYRVDLSQLFSKYIGETEKNLGMIFQEASRANVILFFDEADALFSKRTEVNDSNDKYANAETAYLLQKIEEYRGISILATNFFNNFDQAFVRRLTYAVHLESPNEAERLELWTSILPKETPMAKNIDFKFLADSFELSGSNIKAILYSAAYMAGAEGTELQPKHIVKAMKYEFEKLGRMIDGSQFGKYAGFLYQ